MQTNCDGVVPRGRLNGVLLVGQLLALFAVACGGTGEGADHAGASGNTMIGENAGMAGTGGDDTGANEVATGEYWITATLSGADSSIHVRVTSATEAIVWRGSGEERKFSIERSPGAALTGQPDGADPGVHGAFVLQEVGRSECVRLPSAKVCPVILGRPRRCCTGRKAPAR